MQAQPLERSRPWLEKAVQSNPSEALAWLYLALHRAYEERLDEALEAVRIAQALSPLDPWRYLFDSVAAHVHLARAEWEEGLAFAQRSATDRARHGPTLFYLCVANARLGKLDQAHRHLRQLLELWPRYSLQRFWATYAGRDAPHAMGFAWALTSAGLPD
jgi:tetratricopeptide (TPR) repeat protein